MSMPHQCKCGTCGQQMTVQSDVFSTVYTKNFELVKKIEFLEQWNKKLLHDLEKYEKDAARYRWLRANLKIDEVIDSGMLHLLNKGEKYE